MVSYPSIAGVDGSRSPRGTNIVTRDVGDTLRFTMRSICTVVAAVRSSRHDTGGGRYHFCCRTSFLSLSNKL